MSAFRFVGEVGQGSIPWAFVVPVVLILVLLRYLSIRVASSTMGNNNYKEVSMGKTLIARIKEISSAAVETIWAAGVSYAVGRLST